MTLFLKVFKKNYLNKINLKNNIFCVFHINKSSVGLNIVFVALTYNSPK